MISKKARLRECVLNRFEGFELVFSRFEYRIGDIGTPFVLYYNLFEAVFRNLFAAGLLFVDMIKSGLIGGLILIIWLTPKFF